MEQNNLLFNPNDQLKMETGFFLVRNEIFDLNFKIKTSKRLKVDGKFVPKTYVTEFRELDTFEIATYIYLCRASNNKENAFPSYNTIAEKIKCSRSKAQDCIKVLFDNGFIYKENRVNNKNEYDSNVYYINLKLNDLKIKLDEIYSNSSIPSDNIGNLSDSTPTIPSDNIASMSDGNKKQQHKNNNIFKEKQNNNNKENVVVNLDIIKSYMVQIIPTATKRDINTIYKDIVKLEENIDLRTLELRFNAVKIYMAKNKVENVVGLIRKAIKEQWNVNESIPISNFNNYEQRQYEKGEIEKRMGITI